MSTSFNPLQIQRRFKFHGLPGAEREKQIRAYYEREKAQIPLGAAEFAFAPWRYDVTDHRCPHDAWIQEVRIFDLADGSEHLRSSEIEVVLLGPFHDLTLRFKYLGVLGYSFEAAPQLKLRGHGDWLYDEIHPMNDGIEHHVEFERALFSISAKDLRYTWHQRILPSAADSRP
jgi:hypothetical protein